MAEIKKRGPGRPKGSKNKSTLEREAKEKAKKKAQAKRKATMAENSKARARAKEIQAEMQQHKRMVDEIFAIIVIALGVFFAFCVLSNVAGKIGAVIDEFSKGLFGFMAYVIPFVLIVYGILLICKQTIHFSFKSCLLFVVILVMLCVMNSIRFVNSVDPSLTKELISSFYRTGRDMSSGGYIGMLIGYLLTMGIGKAGCWIFAIVVTIICLLLILNTPLSRLISEIHRKREEKRLIRQNAHLDEEALAEEKHSVVGIPGQLSMGDMGKYRSAPKHDIKIVNSSILENDEQEMPKEVKPNSNIKVEPLTVEKKNSILKYMKDEPLFGRKKTESTGLEEKSEAKEGYGLDGTEMKTDRSGFVKTSAECPPAPNAPYYEPDRDVVQKLSKEEAVNAMLSKNEVNIGASHIEYTMPPITLLDRPKAGSKKSNHLLQEKAEKLEETLRSFNVDANVVQVTQGTTVTRYEVQPQVGVKVSRIVGLENDIALNLEAKSIRIEAPIPGKAAVGIEIENDNITTVTLREIVDSEEFKKAKSKITFAVGKDINGKPIVANLKSMPHLLIAGATGSGKSVCINSIIASIMYKATPDEVKMILIDPKVVELGNYNGIPYLLTPVVTDPQKSAAALNWAVAEMTDRYNKFANAGVKDLDSYNEYLKANGESDRLLPQIVIIIDELADLMMVAPTQVEEAICRITQLARAAGMHLIVATQRPSTDVVTGLIKANIPSRIAFAVSSQIDSRVILDMNGAEKLVGKGDMLFSPIGAGKPIRVQGCFVSDEEVMKLIKFARKQVNPEDEKFKENLFAQIEMNTQGMDGGASETDSLFPEALDLVVRAGTASVSMLQRRFRIGYNRAARIIDEMEEKGFIGPQDGSRGRQVLITEKELEEMES